MTSTDSNCSPSESEAQTLIAIVTEVLFIWTEEIAAKPTKTTVFK